MLAIYFRHGTAGTKYTFAHRLTTDWDVSVVNWLKASGAADWVVAGGDYSEDNKASVEYAKISSWEEYDVTEIVAKFVDGTPNYGFFIVPDESDGNTGRNYISSDNTESESLRPKLTITYETTAITNGASGVAKSFNLIVNRNGALINLFIPFEAPYKIVFIDAFGCTVKFVRGYGKAWHSIDSESVANGLYFVNIISKDKIVAGKYMHVK